MHNKARKQLKKQLLLSNATLGKLCYNRRPLGSVGRMPDYRAGGRGRPRHKYPEKCSKNLSGNFQFFPLKSLQKSLNIP